MSVLCVLANKYPYGKTEAYMESEVDFYSVFEDVFICSLLYDKRFDREKRETPDSIKVLQVSYAGKMNRIVWGLSSLIDPNFYYEIKKLVAEHRFSFKRIYFLINFMSRAHRDARFIYKRIGKDLAGKDVVFYSYRFEYQPYLAILLKKKLKLNKCKIVSRAHGYDLYEERNPARYIPLRHLILKQINSVHPCSLNGEEYLKRKYPGYGDKIAVSYLGTQDYGYEERIESNERFRIVSCSNIVTIKRIDRIIEVLSMLKTKNVEWVHFGTGDNEAIIKKMASEYLGKKENIQFVFKGPTQNDLVMQFYAQNDVQLFINLSDGEGLPVSIMEAFSFGIPCVATNVGGTSEIVSDGVNGFLVSPESTNMEISRIIDSVAKMADREYVALKHGARCTWEQRFNASKCYNIFFSELKGSLGN